MKFYKIAPSILLLMAALLSSCERSQNASDPGAAGKDGAANATESTFYASNADNFNRFRAYAKGDHGDKIDPTSTRIQRVPASGKQPVALRFWSERGGIVGLNLVTPLLQGRVGFEYRIVESTAPHDKFIVFAIPIQKTGDLELGASQFDDPKSPFSSYRKRFSPPKEHYVDGQWHSGSLDFDYRQSAGAAYTIIGPRLNEGVKETGKITVELRNVNVYTSAAPGAK